jgi:hypothetical protein
LCSILIIYTIINKFNNFKTLIKMGCVANMCSNDVEFEAVDMKISKKNCQILEKYGQGALARRETKKI